MVNELILNAVKEASKSHADLPDFEERCIEHAEKLEEFAEELKKIECKEVMTWENENTYNPSCPDFDTYEGRCKYGIACRKENCPKEDGKNGSI